MYILLPIYDVHLKYDYQNKLLYLVILFYLLMLFKIVFLLVNEVKIFYEKFVPFFNLPYRSIVVIVYLVAILCLRMVGTDGCTGQ